MLTVFVAHAGLPVIFNGSTGVTVFFFLSGYLITTLLRREHVATGRISVLAFYARRALRILPALYVAVLLGVLTVRFDAVPGEVSLGGVASQVLHFSNYWIILIGRDQLSPTTLALWSVSVEEHFYLLFPLLFVLIARRKRVVQGLTLAVLCLAILAWRTWVYVESGGNFDRIYLASDTRFDSLLLGCILALVYNPHLDAGHGTRRMWQWIGLAAVMAFWGFQRLEGAAALTWSYTAQGLCLALIFISIIRFPGTLVGRFLNSRVMVRIGVLSYSIYLLHQLAIELVDRLSLDVWTSSLVSLCATCLGAVMLHRWVEQPVLRWRARKRDAAFANAQGS